MPGDPSGKWKKISLVTKKTVIDMKEKGKGNSAIGRELGLSESSVRAILKQKVSEML